MTVNPGRNDPCPCGSGKKYKKCCGAQIVQANTNNKNTPIDTMLRAAVDAHHSGNVNQAKKLYQQVLDRDPNNDNALNLLGVIAHQEGDLGKAAKLISRAVQLDPKALEFHFNLAKVLEEKKDWKGAVTHYQHALDIQPTLLNAHLSLAKIFSGNDQLTEAAAHYEYAVQLEPENADTQLKLAQTYCNLGQYQKAMDHFKQSNTLSPSYEAKVGIGNVYYLSGNPLRSIEWNNNMLATSLTPIQAAQVTASNLMMLSYLPDSTPELLYQEHVNFAKKFMGHLASHQPNYNNQPIPQRRIKVGYVSFDFCAHSVFFFTIPILEHHNSDQVEVYCYYNNNVDDAFTKRVKKHCQHWRDIMDMDDDQVADQIQSDGIDILVDLNGHTAGNRLFVFARKPAPIQISWIGYANTTGLSTMDYRITDNYADPPGIADKYHTEKLIRLPESFSCFSPPTYAADVQPTPALQTGHISFGTFNIMAKITPEVIKVWAKILSGVSGSRLILKNMALNDEQSTKRLVDQFNAHGIDENRLLLLARTETNKEHLQKYHLIDIALDTFPYNGTTTTCDALWMGVPVIVLEGNTHVSRVGVSQMSNMGLPELIAKSEQDYIRIAVELASDLDRLQSLRAGMRDRMRNSPLMDAKRLTQHVENAYREVWKNWCEQQSEKNR